MPLDNKQLHSLCCKLFPTCTLTLQTESHKTLFNHVVQKDGSVFFRLEPALNALNLSNDITNKQRRGGNRSSLTTPTDSSCGDRLGQSKPLYDCRRL